MNVGGGERVRRWEQRTGGWLVALAVLFLLVYALPILRPDLPTGVVAVCDALNWVIWAAFGIDYLVRLSLAENRWRWFREHPFDLLVLVLPMLRQLRLLRLVKALMVVERRTEVWTRGRMGVYVAATTVLLIVVGALGILDAEQDAPGSNISSFWDALWWSIVTATTVGYGDHYPVTATGRMVALGMMLCGIGLLGFVTGAVASWVVERISSVEQAGEETRESVADVVAELRTLRAEVAALRGDGQPPDPGAAPGDTPPPNPPDRPRCRGVTATVGAPTSSPTRRCGPGGRPPRPRVGPGWPRPRGAGVSGRYAPAGTPARWRRRSTG